MKKLEKITMFFAGNPKAPHPERIFFSYDVVSGLARKTNQVFELADFQETETTNQIWDRGISQIEEREGV